MKNFMIPPSQRSAEAQRNSWTVAKSNLL